MQKILVTGGLGYIGSHTVVELLLNGYNVVVIDDLSNTTISVRENIEQITGKYFDFYPFDLKNKDLVTQVFEEHNIVGVIHFAAFKSVGESQAKPLDYYQNNLYSLIHVLQEMLVHKISNFIFSSSCTVYGQATVMPINELTELKKPASCYGKTKQMGEDIIKDFVESHNKKAILLRYFNPIGAHDSALLGELPNGVPNNLLPYVMQVASGIREYLNIWGDDYPTQDGTAIRDYIYVGDLAKAHLAALKKLLGSSAAQQIDVYNLGTGTGTSVMQVIEHFEKVNNIAVPYKICNRRLGDITTAYADASKAKQELDWSANTSLEDALKTAWSWQLKLDRQELV